MSRAIIQDIVLLGLTGLTTIGLVLWCRAVYLYLKKRSYTQLSQIKRFLSLILVAYVILIIGLVLISHNSKMSWIYRSPIINLPWRFAIVYLISIPIIQAIKEQQYLDLKIYVISGIILMLLLLPPVTGFTMFYSITLFLGYFEVILYNPWQVFIPMVMAIIIQLWFFRKVAIKQSVIRRVMLIIGISIWTIMVIVPISTATLFMHPAVLNYKWFQPYISQKYGIDAHPDVFEHSTKPIDIVNDQPTPAGLKIKYLMYGEKAIDNLSMID
jgi:hypothetical protein